MAKQNDLREFLTGRRARLTPEEVGLPAYGNRRVPGLRREEVAQLAGVSVDYYVRLEQGRNRQVSDAVLDAVARALRLDETERVHLRNLARPGRRRSGSASSKKRRLRPAAERLVRSISDGPAFILGRRGEIVASNDLFDAFYPGLAAHDPDDRNLIRYVFLDPTSREVFIDWSTVAREAVGYLRVAAGKHPEDLEICNLVGELSVRSEEFRTLWADHPVDEKTFGVKRLHHPLVGMVVFAYETFRLSDDHEQILVVNNTEPGSEAETSLRILASWIRAGSDEESVPAADRR